MKTQKHTRWISFPYSFPSFLYFFFFFFTTDLHPLFLVLKSSGDICIFAERTLLWLTVRRNASPLERLYGVQGFIDRLIDIYLWELSRERFSHGKVAIVSRSLSSSTKLWKYCDRWRIKIVFVKFKRCLRSSCDSFL